jgi:hypothetical protein
VRYSQPFGTPTPPLGVYPRYINGNPVTGTEGSIVPATSLDEDQIEIITVISNAGLTPDHNDLTQLWQAIQGLIAQKYITTAVTKKVHGAGADFVDLIAAMNWVGQYVITNTGSVTFMLAAGRWTYTQTVYIQHQNSNRISIQAAALLGGSPSYGNISLDATAQIVYLRSVYATELSFTGGISGFYIDRGGSTLRYILITGSQTATGIEGGRGIDARDTVLIDGISIWGFGGSSSGGAGSAGIWIQGALVMMVSGLGVAICNCQIGIMIQNGAFWSQFASQVNIATTFSHCLVVTASTAWFDWISCMGAGYIPGSGSSDGAAITGGGFLASNQGVFSYNGTGVQCTGRSTASIEKSTINGNTYGIVNTGGVVWADLSSFSNGSYDVITQSSGYTELTGAGYSAVAPTLNVWSVGINVG